MDTRWENVKITSKLVAATHSPFVVRIHLFLEVDGDILSHNTFHVNAPSRKCEVIATQLSRFFDSCRAQRARGILRSSGV